MPVHTYSLKKCPMCRVCSARYIHTTYTYFIQDCLLQNVACIVCVKRVAKCWGGLTSPLNLGGGIPVARVLNMYMYIMCSIYYISVQTG